MSLAAVLSATSGPLSGCTRPTKSSTTASWARPNRLLASRLDCAVPGWKTLEVGAGVDGLHLGRVGVVELGQLACLLGRVGDQPVGRRDHVELASDPLLRLGGLADREGRVLDLAQRVHGLHQRHAPALLGGRADLARQPVVRVHEVVLARLGGRLGPQHLEGELADLAGQVGLVQLLEGAGHDAAHEHPGNELGQRRGVPADRPGEDLDLGAPLREPLGDLDYVDVQSARVAGARLVERGRMDAERGDPPWNANGQRGHRCNQPRRSVISFPVHFPPPPRRRRPVSPR